jgi:hypothetical protein
MSQPFLTSETFCLRFSTALLGKLIVSLLLRSQLTACCGVKGG